MSDDTTPALGERLRQRREQLGITLEQAQADTRIRIRSLQALEDGDYEALPDLVVGRGFVRNYAAYLGLNVEEIVGIYAERVKPPEPLTVPSDEPNPFASESFEPVALHDVSGRRARWGWLAAALMLAAAIVTALIWWQYPRIVRWFSPAARPATATTVGRPSALGTATWTPTVPSLTPTSTQPLATAEPTRTATHTPRPTFTPTTQVYTGVFVELALTDTSWIQVTVDGVRQFQGTLPAGTYKSWYGERTVYLRVGNAGAVGVTLNGMKQAPLGKLGEVVDLVYEMVGNQVSAGTATPEPTATRTPRGGAPTATPGGPTPTGSPTLTATSTP